MPTPKPNADWTRRKDAARKYQPKRIRLLLIAESPPAGLERWFYFESTESVDELFAETCSVLFEEPPSGDKVPFLKELRRRGVFVIDLKPDAPREAEPLGPYVAPLLLNLDTLAPESVVPVGAEVYDTAYQALKKAGLPVVDVRVSLPAAGEQVEFRQAFRQALVRAGLEKLIRPLRQ